MLIGRFYCPSCGEPCCAKSKHDVYADGAVEFQCMAKDCYYSEKPNIIVSYGAGLWFICKTFPGKTQTFATRTSQPKLRGLLKRALKLVS